MADDPPPKKPLMKDLSKKDQQMVRKHRAEVSSIPGHKVLRHRNDKDGKRTVLYWQYLCSDGTVCTIKRSDYIAKGCNHCGASAKIAAAPTASSSTNAALEKRLLEVTEHGLQVVGDPVGRMSYQAQWKCIAHGHEFSQTWNTIKTRIKKGGKPCVVCHKESKRANIDQRTQEANTAAATAMDSYIEVPYTGNLTRHCENTLKCWDGNHTLVRMASFVTGYGRDVGLYYTCGDTKLRGMYDNITIRGCAKCGVTNKIQKTKERHQKSRDEAAAYFGLTPVEVKLNRSDPRSTWICKADPSHKFADSRANINVRIETKRCDGSYGLACRVCDEEMKRISRAKRPIRRATDPPGTA